MSITLRAILIAGLAAALATPAAAQMAGSGQQQDPQQKAAIGNLDNHEGIFVDAKSFQITKGAAKGDASAAVARLNAKEISPGAILFRVGEKLYLVEGRPPTTSGAAAATKDFDESLASMMKDFQDQWSVGYMR